MRRDLSRRRFLLSAAALAGGSLLGAGGCTTRTTLSNVAVIDRDWHDAARRRPVPVRFYLPSAISEPLPLVVFSHGIGGSREGYSYLGAYLAAAGIACLHVQHVGSDRRIWWQGMPFSLLDRLRRALTEEEICARVADMRFAIDRALYDEFSARIDPSRIIAAGHSYGANTCLLLAGASIERNGRVLELYDERVSAIAVISAPPFYGERKVRAILSPVSVPSLHVTATEDVIRIPGYYSGLRDRLTIFEMIGSARKSLVVFEGGSHSVFTDRNLTGGLQRNGELKRATRELLLAFVRSTYVDNHHGLAQWRVRHAELLARYDGLPQRVSGEPVALAD